MSAPNPGNAGCGLGVVIFLALFAAFMISLMIYETVTGQL